jgi:hypothetical protein
MRISRALQRIASTGSGTSLMSVGTTKVSVIRHYS